MRASEARELTAQRIQQIQSGKINDIYLAINTAIHEGKYKCDFPKPLWTSEIMELEKDGYKVDIKSDLRNGTICTIIWGHE